MNLFGWFNFIVGYLIVKSIPILALRHIRDLSRLNLIYGFISLAFLVFPVFPVKVTAINTVVGRFSGKIGWKD